MKKLGVAFVAMLVLVSTAFADTQIWSNVFNAGGSTQYSEVTYVNGYDWSEAPADRWQTTGVVHFSVNNDGQVNINTYVNNPGQWVVEKYEDVSGNGNSEIFKQLTVWTEDKSIQNGVLKYPTNAWVSAEFVTETMYDAESVHFLMDAPPAETLGVFTKLVHTSDAFNFNAAQGIGVVPCNPVKMPKFEGITCPLCPRD